MTIQLTDPNLIDPNPYQPATRLTFTSVELADLNTIRDIGLLQPPRARPSADGRFQIIFGWRRRCAWAYFRPGELMPLDIVEATDMQLFEQAAIENGQRQDLSAIEKAGIVQRAINEFGMTQLQAGRLVGLASQGAVSNLLRLLQLPEPARDLIHKGDVPERIARELVPLAKIAPDKVIHIAQVIAKAADADKEDVAENELRDVLRKSGIQLETRDSWPLDWKPQVATKLSADSDEQTIPPACNGCPVHVVVGRISYCGRKSCYAAKMAEWTDRELKRVSAKTGIPIWDKITGKTVHILEIGYANEAQVRTWVQSKTKRPDSLFLAPNDDKRNDFYYHANILGSPNVLLASTVKSILDHKADQIRQEKIGSETESEKAKREAAEAREREKRRDARSAQRKAQSDICWLVFNTAKQLEPQMTITGGVLDYALRLCERFTNYPSSTWNEYIAAMDELKGKHQYWNAYEGRDKITSHPPDEKKRRYILIRQLANDISGYNPETQFDWKRACNLVKLIAAQFGLTLPADWDKPPIHKTSANCWVCGRFTSMDHITKIDEAAGWRTAQDGTVTCSYQCRNDAIVVETHPAQSPRLRVTASPKAPQRKTKRGGKNK